ncbi:MAG: helix-turn-helix domain-containing protein [Thermoflexibacter sp.]|jgi:phage repressor protein C with HTH and peptisase S24 domain|nr:helix-turn-helix domain-containing protein [Thermoflexibacter sp.]
MIDKKGLIVRLKKILKAKTNAELAAKLGLEASAISNWIKRKKFNYSIIFNKIQGIDLHWLLTGKGDMVYSRVPLRTRNHASIENFISTEEFLKRENRPVILIPEKVYAGYLSDFSTERHYQLPIVDFMDYKDGNRYRSFEISGDSMEDMIQAGDYVLGEKLSNLNEINEKAIYVICTYEGLVCKCVETDKNNLILRSINQKYTDKIIQKEDVRELWRVIWIHRKVN